MCEHMHLRVWSYGERLMTWRIVRTQCVPYVYVTLIPCRNAVNLKHAIHKVGVAWIVICSCVGNTFATDTVVPCNLKICDWGPETSCYVFAIFNFICLINTCILDTQADDNFAVIWTIIIPWKSMILAWWEIDHLSLVSPHVYYVMAYSKINIFDFRMYFNRRGRNGVKLSALFW